MGGKKKQTIGYWYRPAFHHGLCKGPIDAFLEFRGGTKKAWPAPPPISEIQEITESGEISIDAPKLWGGEKDQGGIQGAVDVLFGEATQEPNPYLLATFGSQVPGWRGICSVVFKGGRYGAMNPYPQKASYKVRKIVADWDIGECWYEEKAEIELGALIAMNPAHALVRSHTQLDMGRHPIGSINEASLEAAADQLHAEGFGMCTRYNPARESVLDFQKRIERLIDGSFSRSPIDGQWYLDLARGDYVLEELPILTDSDILDFKEQPTALDNVTNSVSVRYFDPQKKEFIVTPAARVMSLIRQFGENHQTYDFPEIPTAALALRVAQRMVLATATPTRVFDLITTRKPYAWRPNQYFRLQAPKRGIADMVCIVGQKESGTLKSGGIKMQAAQDIYSLPNTTYIEIEPGVDLRPIQTPEPITLQRAWETPYIEVVATLPRAELLALPEDVGYLTAVAIDPAQSVDFTLMVEPAGGEYEETANGDWCPSATCVAAAPIEAGPTAVALADAYRLDEVAVGMAAYWDEEICRVTAIDVEAPSVTLSRGCADTVPAEHESGSRLWFWPEGSAADPTEYVDEETVNAKLLTNTGSQQLALDDATAMPVTFAHRLVRPYPPGNLQINAEAYPTEVFGESIDFTWSHRDRLLQEDQLVDTTAASIGPEADVTYNLRIIDADTETELVAETGLTDTTYNYEPAGAGALRVELEAQRGELLSWQKHVWEFDYDPEGGGGPEVIDLEGEATAGAVAAADLSAGPPPIFALRFDHLGGWSAGDPLIDSADTPSTVTLKPGANAASHVIVADAEAIGAGLYRVDTHSQAFGYESIPPAFTLEDKAAFEIRCRMRADFAVSGSTEGAVFWYVFDAGGANEMFVAIDLIMSSSGGSFVRFSVLTNGGGSVSDITSATPLPTTMTDIRAVYDGGDMSLYQGGSLVGTTSVSTQGSTSGTAAEIVFGHLAGGGLLAGRYSVDQFEVFGQVAP